MERKRAVCWAKLRCWHFSWRAAANTRYSMSAAPVGRTTPVTYSYKHIWKRQVFLNIVLVLLVHKQALCEAVLTYFALFILLNNFKSRLSLYIEIDRDHPSPCLESSGSFKKQANTNSHFCENRSCDAAQRKPQIFWEGPNCILQSYHPPCNHC